MNVLRLTLHPRQGQALLTPATEVLYGGAAGGGKSHLLRVALLAWAYDIPGLQGYLFRRTYPELWKNHLEGPGGLLALTASWVDSGFARVILARNRIELANGSILHLCHCQRESDIYRYQGAEIHVLAIDELSQWTRPMYAFLRSRLRLGGLPAPERHADRFPRILCGANPGGLGHNWVKAAFIDLARPGEMRRMPATEGGLLRQYVPARLEDNPTLLENDPEYASRLEGLGNEALVRAMRLGDWDIVAGGAVDDVWERRGHVVPPFPIPATWRVDRSFDWGSSRPFSVGWWAESDGCEVICGGERRTFPKGTLFRIAEYYGWNGRPNEGCRMLSSEVAGEIRHREEEMRLNPWAAKMAVIQPGPADSSIFDIVEGKCLAGEFERQGVGFVRADKSPGSRAAGLEALRRRLKAGLRRPMEEPGLFVFSQCGHFLRTVPVLPRDSRKPDDVGSAAEDHVFDETRYRVLAATHQPTLGIRTW